jgi:uroporphyrinogen-III synthase
LRVLVVRPEREAAETARRLAGLGHEALVAPLFTVAPTDDPVPDGRFDAVLATSARAAIALASARSRFAGTPAFAVGLRTAERMREAGFAPLSADGDASALVELVSRAMRPGAILLHAAGRDRKEEPAASLRARGYSVTVWECYGAAAQTCLPDSIQEALAAGALDAALHYSRRGAETLVALVRKAGLAPELSTLDHACLSADAALGLKALGPSRIAVADEPNEASLLAALGSVSRRTAGARPRHDTGVMDEPNPAADVGRHVKGVDLS